VTSQAGCLERLRADLAETGARLAALWQLGALADPTPALQVLGCPVECPSSRTYERALEALTRQ